MDDPNANPLLTEGAPERRQVTVPEAPNYPTLSDDELKHRAEYVKAMTTKAFEAYMKFASKSLRKDASKGWFGKDNDRNMISSMSTLHVMNCKREFGIAKRWIIDNFEPLSITEQVVVSQLIGDYIGGFLSCYALDGDPIFLDLARQMAEHMEPVYEWQETDKIKKLNNLPCWAFNMRDGTTVGLQVPLSNLTYGVLEYSYLSHLTGDLEFINRIEVARAQLATIERPPEGLLVDTYALGLNPPTPWSSSAHLFRMTRDYYTDLVKGHIQSGAAQSEALETYKKEMTRMTRKGLFSTSQSGLFFTRNYDLITGKYDEFMEHDGLYLGALFALASKAIGDSISDEKFDAVDKNLTLAHHLWYLANELTITGQKVHSKTEHGLAPRRFFFNTRFDGVNQQRGPFFKQYMMMPDLAESYFVLWRMTGHPRWREAAWKLAQTINAMCAVPEGFAGIYRLDSPAAKLKRFTYQPVHLISATFKYLYLTFVEDTVLPLDKWVFNAHGHPLPVKGTHERYPAQPPIEENLRELSLLSHRSRRAAN